MALVSQHRALNAVLVARSAGQERASAPKLAQAWRTSSRGTHSKGPGEECAGRSWGWYCMRVVMCCTLLSLDQLAQDEVGGFLGGKFAAGDGLGHSIDALGVFVAGATGVSTTKRMLLGVDEVIIHRDDDGVLLVTCHRRSRSFLFLSEHVFTLTTQQHSCYNSRGQVVVRRSHGMREG